VNFSNKRGRGRPIGRGKDDSGTLARIADLIVTSPKLKPTTAMRHVLDAGVANNQSVIRRLQVKWRAEAGRYLAQAQARRAVAPARRSRTACSSRTGLQFAVAQQVMHDALGLSQLASVQAAFETPALRAAREMMIKPGMLAAQEAACRFRESPGVLAAEKMYNSPRYRRYASFRTAPRCGLPAKPRWRWRSSRAYSKAVSSREHLTGGARAVCRVPRKRSA
jgi:hypothetical protein